LSTDLLFSSLDSPIGTIRVVCRGAAACAIEFISYEEQMLAGLRARFPRFRRVEASDPAGVCSGLRDYLRGQLDAAINIAVDTGGTPFQREVWAELRRIGSGTVVTYLELAKRLGIPNSVRAVGHANARNPINIVVPCHRIVGADGSLRGYSGGVERKAWLLQHEGIAIKKANGRSWFVCEQPFAPGA
jgi:methylated-DNA-[protein]-cysteine S-methyltransferase